MSAVTSSFFDVVQDWADSLPFEASRFLPALRLLLVTTDNESTLVLTPALVIGLSDQILATRKRAPYLSQATLRAILNLSRSK